ncbi:hypothetical protein LDC_2633, partial [sediment metagenome]
EGIFSPDGYAGLSGDKGKKGSDRRRLAGRAGTRALYGHERQDADTPVSSQKGPQRPPQRAATAESPGGLLQRRSFQRICLQDWVPGNLQD